MFELVFGLTFVVVTSVVLGYHKDDLYDTTAKAACTEEDYKLADLVKNL